MSQQKLVQTFILLLFIVAVTVGIFFLLSMQLIPLMNQLVGDISTTGSVMAKTAAQRPMPTATMPALTLDMLTTVPPTATPAIATVQTPDQLPTPVPASAINRMGTVSSNVVNVRSYPSLAGEVVGQARQGDRLQILATSNDGAWLQVCCPLGSNEDSQQSWVALEFITVDQPPTSASAAAPATVIEPTATTANQISRAPNAIIGTVNSALVNLRSGPGTTYPLVGQVSERTQVEITGRDQAGTWLRICCPTDAPQDSWVGAEFIDFAVAKE